MTVIPGMSILSGFKIICVSLVCGNWTLRHTVDSISFVRMKLTNAMPMDRGSIVRMEIGNMNSLGENQVSLPRTA